MGITALGNGGPGEIAGHSSLMMETRRDQANIQHQKSLFQGPRAGRHPEVQNMKVLLPRGAFPDYESWEGTVGQAAEPTF